MKKIIHLCRNAIMNHSIMYSQYILVKYIFFANCNILHIPFVVPKTIG